MKKLLILRHAKSDWQTGFSSDHERPLNPRGEEAAHAVGRFLSAVDQVPEKILSSSATRARTTVELAAQEGPWGIPIQIFPELYDSSPGVAINLLQREGGEANSILMAGHEPTSSALASLLTGGGELKMVTAALARIDLPISSWQELSPGIGSLSWLVTPKLLLRGSGI